MKQHALIVFTLFYSSFCASTPQQKEVRFAAQFFQPGDLVIDIGACVGDNVDIYLAGGAGVVAVEPQPLCVQILHEKYRLDGRVAIADYGIADTAGERELAICTESRPLSTFSTEWQTKSRYKMRHLNEWDERIIVPVVTLEQLIHICGVPAFCKIDVENFEYEVLSSLKTPIPYLSFEFHEETILNTQKCLDHLSSLGYSHFNFVIMDNSKFVLSEWVDADALLQAIANTSQKNRFGELLCGDIYAHHTTSTHRKLVDSK